MIRENQRLFNILNILSDGVIIYLMLPLAFWVRFYLLPDGIISVPLSEYLVLGFLLTAMGLFTYTALGLYQSFRRTPLVDELTRLWLANLLDMAVLLSVLFLQHEDHFSRKALAIFFLLSLGALTAKRIVVRKLLRRFRQRGYNQKHVVIIGSGPMARTYYETIQREREIGRAHV